MQHPRSLELSAKTYLATDTIAALSSATGGAIAIVRVSGPRADSILLSLTRQSSPPTPRLVARAKLVSQAGAALDDAVVLRFVAPHSFTGEDLVELHIHGGGYGASRILSECLALGARQAGRGEFSFRALRNGKLSVTQALAIHELITAQNAGAIELALEKLSGAQNAQTRQIADDLRSLAVASEVGIDFSDQDVESVALATLKKKAITLLTTLRDLEQSFDRGKRIQDGVSVAILGRPNAGKSSFFNALLGEDRSIVTDQPGTTRDVVRESLTLHSGDASVTFRLEDTAGLREAQDRAERLGIERSRAAAKSADIVLFLFEPCTADSPQWREQCALWEELDLSSRQARVVLTKADTMSPAEILPLTARLGAVLGQTPLVTSAETGAGITAASQALVGQAKALTARNEGEILLTRLDHLHAVASAAAHLDRALTCEDESLFAADVRQALSALEPLIGQTLPDAILGKIFSDFCIGK